MELRLNMNQLWTNVAAGFEKVWEQDSLQSDTLLDSEMWYWCSSKAITRNKGKTKLNHSGSILQWQFQQGKTQKASQHLAERLLVPTAMLCSLQTTIRLLPKPSIRSSRIPRLYASIDPHQATLHASSVYVALLDDTPTQNHTPNHWDVSSASNWFQPLKWEAAEQEHHIIKLNHQAHVFFMSKISLSCAAKSSAQGSREYDFWKHANHRSALTRWFLWRGLCVPVWG